MFWRRVDLDAAEGSRDGPPLSRMCQANHCTAGRPPHITYSSLRNPENQINVLTPELTKSRPLGLHHLQQLLFPWRTSVLLVFTTYVLLSAYGKLVMLPVALKQDGDYRERIYLFSHLWLKRSGLHK